MQLVKGYYSASIRGRAGNAVTDEQYTINLNRGILRGQAIQRWMGEILELYIPHEHDTIIHRMWRKGQIHMNFILEADFELVRESDFLIVDGFQSCGVLSEMDEANQEGIQLIILEEDQSFLSILPDISAMITNVLFAHTGQEHD